MKRSTFVMNTNTVGSLLMISHGRMSRKGNLPPPDHKDNIDGNATKPRIRTFEKKNSLQIYIFDTTLCKYVNGLYQNSNGKSTKIKWQKY